MKSFFYFVGFLLTLMNLGVLIQYNKFEKIREWFVKFKKITNREPKKSEYQTGENEKLQTYTSVMTIDFLWLFLGLLTNDIRLFAVTLGMTYVLTLMTKTVGDFTPVSKGIGFLKILMVTVVITMASLNHFHGNMDLWQLIVGK